MYTLKSQIEAIRVSMRDREEHSEDFTKESHWKKLNDAASTISALALSKPGLKNVLQVLETMKPSTDEKQNGNHDRAIMTIRGLIDTIK